MTDLAWFITVYLLAGLIFVGWYEAAYPSKGDPILQVFSWLLVVVLHPFIFCVQLGRWIAKPRDHA